MHNMTGRPASRTMERNGRSSASCLARTPCVPLFCTLFYIGLETEGLLDYQHWAEIISILWWNLRPVIPPGTKPIHAGTFSWGINFCANTCAACIRTRANIGKYYRGGISRVLCQSHRPLGEFIRCEYMPRLYSHLREYRKIFLANYLCIGFVPGGIRC